MAKRRRALALPEYDAAGLAGLDKEALKYRINLLEQVCMCVVLWCRGGGLFVWWVGVDGVVFVLFGGGGLAGSDYLCMYGLD